MNLIGISINHRTAPIELREALHLNKEETTDLITKLKNDLLFEGLVLSTCNRTEIFGIPGGGIPDYKKLIKVLTGIKPVQGMNSGNFELYFSCSAVKHIFKVASGIDSLVIGDSQILSQVKDAFQLAEDLDFVESDLKRVFDTAVKVGKRAIKETSIGEGAVSISYAAVQVVEKIFSDLSKKSALVIGAGETGELAAVHLRDKGVNKLTITNRTLKKAEILAQKLNAEVIPYDSFKEHLERYDIIFSATSAGGFILEKTDIAAAMKKRKGALVCLMDIALPRDINPEAAKLDNVFYNDIDSLNIIINQNINKRKKELPVVEKIIMEEMINFFSWYNTLDVVPTIKGMREFFENITNDELGKIKNKITDEDYAKVEDMTRRLVGRILHNPTMKLRELAETGVNTRDAINHSIIVKNLFRINGSDRNNKNEKENRG